MPAGSAGRPSHNEMNSGDATQQLPGKLTMNMKKGDVFRHEQPGTGGWGDPLEREPARIAKDVRNEFVSRESARRDYGVVFKGDTLEVDDAATTKARAEIRARRGWSEPPVIAR